MRGRNIFLSIVVLLVMAAPLVGAESVFVTSRVAVLYDQASTAGKRLGTLKQGDELTVVSKTADWSQITTKDNALKGWVSNIFVGATPSVTRKDLGAGMSDLSNVATRTRASAYTTSAAGTRGLSTDNPRQRENLAFSDYDFTVSPWLDTFVFTDADIEAFAVSQGIAL